MFDKELVEKIREAFPRAEKDFNGRERAFFDNGTGTLVVKRAAEAEAEARINCSANIGGVFNESKQAEAIIKAGREDIADFINAPSSETIISGESATSLVFNISYALGKDLTGKENIVTTNYEHYTNVSPWEELVERGKIKEVRYAKLNMGDGTIDLDHLDELIDENTKIVAVTAASNMLGTKSPLKIICKMARKVGAYFFVDAVHQIVHGLVDVQALDCDFLVFSAYKLFSSHGSFLYGKKELLETLKPFKVKTAPTSVPGKFEWGTRNQAMFAAITGVMEHFQWIAKEVQDKYEGRFMEYEGRRRELRIAMDAIEQNEKGLSKAVLIGFDGVPGLLKIPEVTVYGITGLERLDERVPTFSFEVEGIEGEEVARRLWEEGNIAARSGHFYSLAQDVHNKQKVVRISLVQYNTLEEVRTFLIVLKKICTDK
ncbi:MAG: aminotransferase class V-fold PLP-dependent enzyme [Candidatus Heimdallarchaeota archaeon]|nr:aminotransferase class V-fold PLP-dependent enzyme [Candidatus Heimdallarchaeota archaeon]